MAHQLIIGYGLYRKMNVYQPNKASDQQMAQFHCKDYIEHLKRVTPGALERPLKLTTGLGCSGHDKGGDPKAGGAGGLLGT